MKTPTTDRELDEALDELADWIALQCEEPSHWPLTDEGRVHFVRSAYIRAKHIRTSEPFLRRKLLRAAALATLAGRLPADNPERKARL